MELNVELLKWQQEVFNDPTRFKVIAAGRRCGKSRLAAWTLLLAALQSNKGHVFYVAPTLNQARDIMWGVLQELGRPVITHTHINNMQITLVNGATISLKGSDRPDTMRGVSLAYLVMDEYADMKPQVWEEVLRPALTDQKAPAMFIGTPKGRNHFYEMYNYARLSEDIDYKAWHFTSYDNETLDPNEINNAKKSMSSQAFRQEYLSSFEASGEAIFKESWLKFDDKTDIDGDYFIAIDLAGFEEVGKKKSKNLDNTAITIVKAGEEGWFVEKILYGRWTLEETCVKIFNAVKTYKPNAVGIERGIAKQAVMSPLLDMMKRYSFFFNIQELTHSNQKKADRITWALQGRFEHGLITLKVDPDWNERFVDEYLQFPSPLTHDDLIDSLAYIDQVAKIAYQGNWNEIDEYETLDSIAGY